MQTDPLTFEALRHRVTTIADEGSSVLRMVSSSPVASEANDCNVAIMDVDGAAVAIGPGLSSHGIACTMTARFVLAEYGDDPGIRDGDMFLANDPYRCTPHQTCFALVSPVWWQGTIAAWVGAGIHVPDAGGPVAGQVAVGAQSIYQEATPMMPLRIVEGGAVRNDLEREFVVRSRTPQQLALDLRAMIAACERLSARVRGLLESYGEAVVTGTFEDMVLFSQAHLQERIAKVPDGEWLATAWLDYPDTSGIEFYACDLVVRKADGHLTLDFTGSSPQAPAVINCGEPGLVSSVTNAVMAILGYGLPLCPEAVLRTVNITSSPGTFVHATHPAGCSKATTAACMAVRQALNLGLSKMFLGIEELESRVLAGSGGFLPVIDMSGRDRRGQRFGVPLLDIALSAGYGAMPEKDGIDSAGTMGSPSSSIANVETYEARYPILYLWRRHAADSGGRGRYRGGRGLSLAFTPHGVDGDLHAVLHGHGCAVPSTPGIAGGHPGATNTFLLVRNARGLGDLRAGVIPQDEGSLRGESEPAPGLYQTSLAVGDVVVATNNGGGGLGDPLERKLSSIRGDIAALAVTVQEAAEGYGVVFRGRAIDEKATRLRRDELRRQRRDRNGEADRHLANLAGLVRPDVCRSCGATIASDELRTGIRPLADLGGAIVPHGSTPEFHAVESVCPRCGTLLDVAVVRADTAGAARARLATG